MANGKTDDPTDEGAPIDDVPPSRFADDVRRGVRCAHERRWTDPCSTCGNGPDTARGAIATLASVIVDSSIIESTLRARVEKAEATLTVAVAAEREACAIEADAVERHERHEAFRLNGSEYHMRASRAAARVAAAIRARVSVIA